MYYDPNESAYPLVGEPVKIEIMRAEEAVSAKGRDMLILHCTVCHGQPGADYETKFYAMSFHLRDILPAVGMDAGAAREVDPLQFRGRTAMVTFKREAYKNKDGEDKTATKIDRWISASEAATAPAPGPDDEPPLENYSEPGDDDGVDIGEDGTTTRQNPKPDRIPF